MIKEQLGIYIHIPFCVKKCLYCDFLSFPSKDELKIDYVNRLLKEIQEETEKGDYKNHIVHTIFIGGGTPSILESKEIDRILCKLKHCFDMKEDAEITIEVNPGTVTKEKCKDYFSMGINRLSIGLQSANEEELKTLGRIHTYQDFLDTFYMARSIGYSNINVDLMSALPGQTIQSWQNTLQKVIKLNVEHISAYSLIIEEETPFFEQYGVMNHKNIDEKTYPSLPDEDGERSMYELTGKMLTESGYYPYEISNYAKKGFECKHNCAYWKRNDYIGFGIGSASLIKNVRRSNIRELNVYVNQYLKEGVKKKKYVEPTSIQELSLKEQMEEFMFLGLRMINGVSKKDFFEIFHKNMREVYGTIIDDFLKKKLLIESGDQIKLSKKGVDLSNYVMAEFLFE